MKTKTLHHCSQYFKMQVIKIKKKLHFFFAQSSVTTQTELASCSLQTADYNTNVV